MFTYWSLCRMTSFIHVNNDPVHHLVSGFVGPSGGLTSFHSLLRTEKCRFFCVGLAYSSIFATPVSISGPTSTA